jgi:hypothetical protein
MSKYTFIRFVRTTEQTTVEADNEDAARKMIGDGFDNDAPGVQWTVTDYEIASGPFTDYELGR